VRTAFDREVPRRNTELDDGLRGSASGPPRECSPARLAGVGRFSPRSAVVSAIVGPIVVRNLRASRGRRRSTRPTSSSELAMPAALHVAGATIQLERALVEAGLRCRVKVPLPIRGAAFALAAGCSLAIALRAVEARRRWPPRRVEARAARAAPGPPVRAPRRSGCSRRAWRAGSVDRQAAGQTG
jgi:hypothetical protein